MKCSFHSIFTIICLLLMLAGGCSYKPNSLYVDLGNATAVLPPPPANVYRIFIDRLGNVYPNVSLPRTVVQAAGCDIEKAIATNVALQQQLLTRYNVTTNGEAAVVWQNLQQAITTNIIHQVNQAAAGYSSITLIIHGIGNDINEDNLHLNRNPYYAYQAAEQHIDSLLRQSNRKTFYIEVYWDALHRVKKLDFIHVFAGARTNSYYVGLGLRNIVSHLQTDSLVILTHSLGAGVGCQLLFNRKVPAGKRALHHYTDSVYADALHHATPPQKSIHLGMVAPAIAGKSTFKVFYQRTGTSAPSGAASDRYAVWVGYNNKDRIITKGLLPQFQSPLLVRYAGGSTALGGLRGENKQVAKLFQKRYPQSSFTAIDFQDGGGNLSPQTAHYFTTYSSNQHFSELVRALYGLSGGGTMPGSK